MNPFKLSISLSLLLSLAVTAKAQPKYIHHFCSNTTIFSTNSTYQANLYVLFSFLSSNASRPLGFHYTSAGQNPDDVYGSFLCRGDYSPDVCQDCVSFATQVDLARRCPVEEEAMIWYDQCFVRYSNSSFFSTMEQEPMIYNRNVNNVTDVGLLRYLLNTTMSVAAAEAASIPSEAKKFAVKEVDFEESQKLYYLVQCTPDLSGSDCNSCLQIAISLLLEYCDRSKGGRMWCPSCGVRYEMYIFFNTTVLGAPPFSPVDVLPPATRRTTEIGTSPPEMIYTGKRGISTVTIVAIVAAIFVSVVLSVLRFCLARKKCNGIEDDKEEGGEEISSLQFDLSTLTVATKDFSDDNKLGEGGFGQVYKGTLPDGQEIAVKRLSRSSVQGAGEFKNEVLILAKLQHRNLVKLMGYCLEAHEKILVYEFVPNKSLDYFLFDPEKRGQLDWRRRYKIIEGIATGCLYLHEDSRPRVIHRDLKASNILLDKDMNPKISDFGMARIFGVDQSHADTSRIAGTLGYMPPEYAMHGLFSVKSDAYSFGVLVLEIISGKKINSFIQTDSGTDGLVGYAWKHWRNGTPMEVLDPNLVDSYSRNEVLTCIQIGLLCVQKDPAERPTMKTVVLMLKSYSATLPVPQEPAFFIHGASRWRFTLNGLESDQSASKTVSCSVDEASITEVHPR